VLFEASWCIMVGVSDRPCYIISIIYHLQNMKPWIILRLRALSIALDKINSTTDLGALEEKIIYKILRVKFIRK
jgi:hypothetical protein